MKAHFNRFYEFHGKRIFDLLFSLIFISILAIPLLIITILVLICIGKPVFFIQERPGKDEKIFRLYKFRTMTNEKDSNGILLDDEYRQTSFGNFLRITSLDELPQFFNVIKGELSLIGPRPLLVEYLPLYDEFQRKRHRMRPGITGWAQVNGRNAITWAEKFELDNWYIDHFSFFMDVKILLLTFKKVIRKSDISSGTSVSMEKFSGNK